MNATTRWWMRGLLRLAATVLLCVLLAVVGYLLIVGIFLSLPLHALA